MQHHFVLSNRNAFSSFCSFSGRNEDRANGGKNQTEMKPTDFLTPQLYVIIWRCFYENMSILLLLHLYNLISKNMTAAKTSLPFCHRRRNRPTICGSAFIVCHSIIARQLHFLMLELLFSLAVLWPKCVTEYRHRI